MEACTVGTLKNTESILTYKEQIGKEGFSGYGKVWKLTYKQTISSNLSRFDFKTADFFVKPVGKTITWFGRHFSIRFKESGDGKTRLYTTCLSLCENLREFRKGLVQNLLEGHGKIPEFVMNSDILPLFIKKYDFPDMPVGFSRDIHNVDVNDDRRTLFAIEGPMGRGLELGDLNGNIVFICAGTGILPFLDFLNFLLMRSIYQVFKAKGSPLASKIEEIGLDLRLEQKIKVNFYGAFPNESDTYGLEILTSLAEISNKFGLDVFEAKLSSSSNEFIKQVKGRFDEKYIRTHVDLKASKYFVCGPPAFNTSVPRDLNANGVAMEKIELV